MKKTKPIVGLLLAATMVMSLAACGGNSGGTVVGGSTDTAAPAAATEDSAAPADTAAAPEASAGTLLNTSITTTPDTCDPARGSGENDDYLYVNVYEALIKPSETDGAAEGWLAKDWTYDEATMTYTFNLVDNACFADGAPLTAKDVVYTLDRIVFTIYKGHDRVCIRR